MVEGKRIRALVDTGAGPSAMTDKLRRELEIPITGKSNVILTIADGKSIASLGTAKIEVQIDEDLGIELEVEVIDSNRKDLILGTDLLRYGIIDMQEGLLTIELDGEEYEIPIDFEGRKRNSSENQDESSNDSESDESSESDDSSDDNDSEYEDNEKKELFSFVDETQKTEGKEAKRKVLALERERP
jgi:hypothetical protein